MILDFRFRYVWFFIIDLISFLFFYTCECFELSNAIWSHLHSESQAADDQDLNKEKRVQVICVFLRLMVLEKVKFTNFDWLYQILATCKLWKLKRKFKKIDSMIGFVQFKMSAPAPPSGAGGATLEGVRVRSPRTNRRSLLAASKFYNQSSWMIK